MRRIAPLSIGLGLILALGCYTDDTGGPTGGKPLTPKVTVHLTDDPFPFDSVAAVNLYVDSIEASTAADSAGYLTPEGAFVTIAAPHRAINLLDFQQGAAELLGQGTLKVGQYKSIRMTIDADSTSVLWSGGIPMEVDWGRTGRIQLYAVVEPAFSVADSGADLVLDFDVGRSFQFNQLGRREFDVQPNVRAVNSAETGAIEGTVTDTLTPGSPQPVANANVTVILQNTYITTATGRTDAQGHYKVAFLPEDVYQVQVVQPLIPALRAASISGIQVTKRQTTALAVVLPSYGAQPASIHITGPDAVSVGGHIILQATVTDSQGNPVLNPTVTWTSSNPGIARTEGFHSVMDSTFGVAPGSAYVYAATNSLKDSVLIFVDTTSTPDSTGGGGGGGGDGLQVVIAPALAIDTLAVGDTATFTAYVADFLGNPVTGHSLVWITTDSTVLALSEPLMAGDSLSVTLTVLRAGQATLEAVADDKRSSVLIVTH